MCKLIVTLLLAFAISAVAENKELTIASDPWCPFSCEKEASDQGIAVDLVKAAFEPLGYKIKYQEVAFLRSIQELKLGHYDMVSAVDETLDPTTFIKGQESIFKSNFSFFTKKDSNFKYDSNSEECFKGITIGVNGGDELKGLLNGSIGSYINKYLDDSSKVKKVLGKDVHLQLIGMLKEGRIDLYIDTEQVALYYIKKANASSEIVKGSVISKEIDEYIGFSPAKDNAQELLSIFDKRMIELKKDGSYAKIMQKYGLN